MKRFFLILAFALTALSFSSCINVDDLKPDTPVYQPEDDPEEKPEEKQEEFDLSGTPDGTEVQLTGVVAVVTKYGFLLNLAGDKMLYVYAGQEWNASLERYDKVTVSGVLTTYWNNRELTLSSVKVIGSGSISNTAPFQLTQSNIQSFAKAGHLPCMVKTTGVFSIDGEYINLHTGDDTYLASIESPTFDVTRYNGKNVSVIGYYLWTSSSTVKKKYYVNIAVTEITLL